MKKLLPLLCLLCLIFNSLNAQFIVASIEGSNIPRSFKLGGNMINIINKRQIGSNDAFKAAADDRVTIVSSTNDSYVIRIKRKNLKTHITVPKNEIAEFLETIKKKWSPIAGSFTFPVRWRPQSGTFETSVSLSMVGGFKKYFNELDKKSISILIGAGPSSIELNNDNTNATPPITSNTNRSAVTISLSAVFQWQSLQILFSSGLDNNLNNKIDNWKYQSKLWVSFGVGFNVFKPEE